MKRMQSAPRSQPLVPAVQVQRDIRSLARALGQRRRLRLTTRAIWLCLGLLIIGRLIQLAGFAISWPMIIFPVIFVFSALLIRAWLGGPSLTRLAREYDHHFQLHEVLSTGLEVSRLAQRVGQPTGPVEQRQMEQALLTMYALRRRIAARSVIPWRDIEILTAVALIAIGLLLVGRGPLLPDVSPLALQSLPESATEQPVPTPNSADAPQPAADKPSDQMSPADQQAAQAIADALRNTGATQSAADALERNDAGQAASDLRNTAGQADQLSDSERTDLANGLRNAADQLSQSQPERSGRLQQQAEELQSTPQGASAALNDLADMVDDFGKQPSNDAAAGQPAQDGSNGSASEGDQANSGGQGSGNGGQGLGGESRGTITNPPNPSGDVAPLPPAPDQGGALTSATGPQGPTVQLDAGGSHSVSASAPAAGSNINTPLQGDADPLRIPPEYRDVVENYFSPGQ